MVLDKVDTAALVAKAVALMCFFQDYQERTAGHPELEWSQPEWEERKRILGESIIAMWAALADARETLAQHGWEVTAKGIWRQIEPAKQCEIGIHDAQHEEDREELPEAEEATLFDPTEVVQHTLSPWA